MNKKILKHIKSTAIPLSNENVDTDQIIPARFLKATTRERFGENLFRDWRFNSDGTPKPDFILNDPNFKGEILVAGKNFGSGSSREHAAWALADYGFSAVVSSFFADIFKNNSLNNSLLPVVVSEDFLQKLFHGIKNNPEMIIEIDIPSQKISVSELQMSENFDINLYKKMCLLRGYDDVDYLLSAQNKTIDFERSRKNDYLI